MPMSYGDAPIAGQLAGNARTCRNPSPWRAAFCRTELTTEKMTMDLKLTDQRALVSGYLCSPLASATNGAALRVDGGVVQACF